MLGYLNNFYEIYKVLKRIDNESVFTYRLDIMFDVKEQSIIKLLYSEGYIKNYLDKNTGIERVILTNNAKMSIFAVEHKEDIIRFKDALECLNCDTAFIFDFLRTRDLNKEIFDIFSLKDYEIFLEEKEMYNPKIKRKNMS